MRNNYMLTGTERDVMAILWESQEPTKTRVLLDKMGERGRNWKRQTLNTVLFRLEERKLVERERGQVHWTLTPSELLQKQTQSILDDMYDGKIENFVAAWVGNIKIEDAEAQKLKSLIDGWR